MQADVSDPPHRNRGFYRGLGHHAIKTQFTGESRFLPGSSLQQCPSRLRMHLLQHVLQTLTPSSTHENIIHPGRQRIDRCGIGRVQPQTVQAAPLPSETLRSVQYKEIKVFRHSPVTRQVSCSAKISKVVSDL